MTTRRAAIATIAALVVSACDATIARLRGKKLVSVVKRDQLGAGDAYRTKIGDAPIILVDDGGEIRGFSAVCTHEGCPLGWNPDQHLIRCPCHGSAFDTHGQVVNGPAKLPLTQVETFVERGEILVAWPTSSS